LVTVTSPLQFPPGNNEDVSLPLSDVAHPLSGVDTYSSVHPFAEGESDAFRPSKGELDGLPVALTL
jgi:hypothetical protein